MKANKKMIERILDNVKKLIRVKKLKKENDYVFDREDVTFFSFEGYHG